MRILITGGCGFIGSHLAEELISGGHEVSVIDDLSTGSVDNVRHLLSDGRFRLQIDSILNVPVLEEMIRGADFVFHLAAVVGVRRVLESPVDSVLINVQGTENVLRQCAASGKGVLITSTSEIYGKNERVPFVEDEDIIIGSTKKSRWSYACAKAVDEFLAFAYHQEKNLPVIIVRLFNTVGPRQSERYGMVIPRFVTQALSGSDITVLGDGTQTRCFLHVKDAVSALVRIIGNKEAYGDVFNIGSREEISIRDLACLVMEMTGSSSRIVHMDPAVLYRFGFEDMRRRVPDTSRIEKLIGFSPRHSVRDIVAEVISFYRAGADKSNT